MRGQNKGLVSTTAKARIREELKFIQNEIDAFVQLKQRIKEVPCIRGPRHNSISMSLSTLSAQTNGSVQQKLEDAYRSTVMATPHYESEYGDTFEESVRAEFDAAGAQVFTGEVQYTPLVRSGLVEACEQALTNRATYRKELADEVTELSHAIERCNRWLKEIQHTKDRLQTWNDCWLSDEVARLENIRCKCDELAASRQATLRKRPTRSSDIASRFEAFLYADESFNRPVLADIGYVGRQVEQRQSYLERRAISSIY
jgi:hypothetical protein